MTVKSNGKDKSHQSFRSAFLSSSLGLGVLPLTAGTERDVQGPWAQPSMELHLVDSFSNSGISLPRKSLLRKGPGICFLF